jgi:hypothetical protein
MYALDIGSSSNLYRIDAATGAATLIAATTLSSPPAAAFSGDDVLHVVDINGDLYTVDEGTGVATFVGATGIFVKGFDFNPLTGILWASDASGNIYRMHPVAAVPMLLGNTGLNPSPDIHFDQAGNLYGVSGGGLAGNNLISIDTGTAAGTIIGSVGFSSVSGLAMRLGRVITGIADGSPRVKDVVLYQNHPNPFNPSTTISYRLEREAGVTLSVYDVAGRLVVTLAVGTKPAGVHHDAWDGRDRGGRPVASGTYFYRLTAGNQALTRKAVLLK